MFRLTAELESRDARIALGGSSDGETGTDEWAMGWSEDEVPEFVKDPSAYAQETHRMAEELQRHVFPPWRWVGWYRRRRVIEERLHNLRVLQRAIEESEHEGG